MTDQWTQGHQMKSPGRQEHEYCLLFFKYIVF